MENAGQYSKYGAYTVTVTLHNRSRNYNAIFLFGSTDGRETFLPVDTVTGNSALEFFATHGVYPDTLVRTSLSKNRVVSDWLKSDQVNDSSCRDGSHEVCCNATAITCGIPARDVPVSVNRKHRQRKAKLELASFHVPLDIFPTSPFLRCSNSNYTPKPALDATANSSGHVTGQHTLERRLEWEMHVLWKPPCRM
jgi:hypothetical protein